MELDEFRRAFDAWLDEHADDWRPTSRGGHARRADGADRQGPSPDVRRGVGSLRLAGAGRWPRRFPAAAGVPGRGLTARDLVYSGVYSLPEVLGPSFVTYAPPDLSAAMIPPLLRGDEVWCQGFSEPGTGSNLGSLACRAVAADDGWRVTGQKVWTSLAQYSQRCVLLTRTGTLESAHRGITALFVDMDTPGINRTADRDDARRAGVLRDVLRRRGRSLRPHARRGRRGVGVRHGPPAVRAQHRAVATRRVPPPAAAGSARRGRVEPRGPRPSWGGGAARLRVPRPSRATKHRQGERRALGAETSIDKVLLATAEQAVFELVAEALPGAVTLGDDVESERWRSEFLCSRAATIYGGTARSSATSSPGAWSTWGTTDDRRTRSRAVRAQPAQRDGTALRRRARHRAGGVGLARRALVRSREPRCRGVRAPG